MPTAKVQFKGIKQNVQFTGTDDQTDDQMLSELLVQLTAAGKTWNLTVVISQPCGTDYETTEIEVGRPVGYDGPWNHNDFAELAEQYYRSQMGASGAAIKFGGGGLIMRDNLVLSESPKFEMPLPEEGGGGW